MHMMFKYSKCWNLRWLLSRRVTELGIILGGNSTSKSRMPPKNEIQWSLYNSVGREGDIFKGLSLFLRDCVRIVAWREKSALSKYVDELVQQIPLSLRRPRRPPSAVSSGYASRWDRLTLGVHTEGNTAVHAFIGSRISWNSIKTVTFSLRP